ncbi:MAG: RpiB/LacA/LacB family sugar-phosphate isomerase [Oscillospiraceae bacterium]|jgi:ribose 5-phosphate isomerase B|nr:RpiB/LacA/LacB family sugar-phosphate isomerase [Oscillospiraceae bacterium]
MNIIIGGDRSGFELKQKVLKKLEADGHAVTHVGSYSADENVDFPDVARKICKAILSGDAQRGIMVCGTGVGAAIACNKVRGIRASVVHDIYTAHQCVEHDDVQVMAMGGQIVGDVVAYELIDLFLNARYSGDEMYRIRLEKLEQMEVDKD